MGKITYKITAGITPQRLDTYISSRSGLSRSYIQRLLREGLILINSHPEKASYKIREGDLIEITIPDKPQSALIPEDIPIEVIHEDSHIIVVNKPHGMVVYPSAGHPGGTLLNALISRLERPSLLGGPLRPGVVHRLDKDTSGIMILAKDDTAYINLGKQFRERSIEKHYIALLYGILRKDHGEIKTPVGRSISDRKRMSTKTRKGREAITSFRVLRRLKCATLVDVRLITGRTHQIRVHFASIGHPVLGDKTYGKKTTIRLAQKSINFPRQMLHAFSLKFNHPIDGRSLEFTAPMPKDMEKAMEELMET